MQGRTSKNQLATQNIIIIIDCSKITVNFHCSRTSTTAQESSQPGTPCSTQLPVSVVAAAIWNQITQQPVASQLGFNSPKSSAPRYLCSHKTAIAQFNSQLQTSYIASQFNTYHREEQILSAAGRIAAICSLNYCTDTSQPMAQLHFRRQLDQEVCFSAQIFQCLIPRSCKFNSLSMVF